MEATKRVLVVLATVLVAAECLETYFKRDSASAQQSNCVTEADACAWPLRVNLFSYFRTYDFRPLIANFDEKCQLIQEASDCLQPTLNRDECGFMKRNIRDWLSVGDFVCSQRGRSLLSDMLENSQCLNNPNLLGRAYDSIGRCIDEAKSASDELLTQCQTTRLEQGCWVQGTTEHCGQAVGELVDEITNRLLLLISQYSCDEDSSSENLKRGFDLFRKRFV